MFSRSVVALFALLIGSAQAGKRGLAWPWCINPGVLNGGNGQVVAIYDWETYAPPTSTGNTGGLGFIGMQAKLDSPSSPVSQLAARQKAQGWATVFSLNEPDINGISPQQAAEWYIKWINPLAIKKALPAVTSSGSSGQGLSWLSQMISACGGRCYYDYINLHCLAQLRPYLDYRKSFAEFKAYVEHAHSQFPSSTIVISEFALTNGGDQLAFFKSAFPFLDGLGYIHLYFPFVSTSPALLQANDGNAASYVGTGSCLYTNAGGPSAVGTLLKGASRIQIEDADIAPQVEFQTVL
ncbi:glycoside hydrolase family 128 protein [Collybiopsis luxurians FD-317 M1]|uniref:Glycoside hydrolase family 128 protein n=1 Tax=Collybiopsis luxurians FD-317 M1 TaxID=944289 RepID=A0A0D0CC70_9AGAR|nr:glycoside hydrolase family 128 protein [Collybiopsis luxurians FD-317 M1]